MAGDRSSAKQQIEKLVHFFDTNLYQFKSPSFNETQARQQLIDPFFEALGWDVHNSKMQPLYLQEVIPEGRVKTTIGKEVREQQALFSSKETLGAQHKEYDSILDYIAEDAYKASTKEAIKKPDYRFRIHGQTKFFVEAKKPSVDLVKSQEAIFQVKRYGFSGRVPLSILTDFAEFRVFDCTHKPEFDKPKLGIIKDFDLTYKHYLDDFERIFDTFSRDAVQAGSLDTLARKLLQKRTGDFALDKAFLDDLSKWREELARDIAKHPKNRRRLNDYTLNESVQRILDRLVFFRVCEDREIEVEHTLLAILRMWKERPNTSLYSLLNDLFNQRRSLYNGLLFAEHECEQLEISNEVLIKILQNLNYPFSPYHFNEIGVEILGSIYEKFLGKTIHLTAKTTRIEEKPEVRKAGGVYYTPQYIVKYIVANTLGKLLYEEDEQPSEGHSESKRPSEGNKKLKLSPKQVAKLKIIDIACGSGSFLLGAFQELIDYHLAWYAAHPKDIETKNNVPDAMPDANGNLHLSARKKRDILVNNIYGVDIDRQAVEVTQMSLYLKVLENENAETLNPQMTLALKEVYLPSMANNIKCGNSLIGTDFTAQGDLFNDEARRKVNPFDWEMEFPEILGTSKEPHPNPPLLGEGRERLQSRGFDVVIGNPPYVRQESLGENFKRYVCGRYKCFIGTADLYIYFIEKAHTILSNGGYYGMICSGKFMRTSYGEPLRKFISTNSSIQEIIDFGELPVFESASTFPIVIITKNGKTKSQQFKFTQVKSLEFDSLWEVTNQSYTILDNSSLDPNGWTLASEDVVRLINKIKSKGVTLGKYLQGNIYRGVLTGLNEAFLIDELTRKKIVSKDRKAERLIKRFVVGDDVRKYRIRDSKTFIIMIPNGWTRKEMIKGKDKWKSFGAVYPSIASHLKPFITKAQKRIDKGEYWWELRPCDYYSEMEKPKIIWPEIAKESRFSFDDSSYFPNKTCFFSVSSDKYLLGILNSQTIWFILKNYCSILGDVQNGGRLLQQKIYIEQLPIRTIDFTNPAEKKIHDNLVALVEKMLTLNKELQGKNFDSEKEPIQRQIAATDKKIDSLVYELYGLTEEEIKIVENKE